MNIIALDSSTEVLSVALAVENEVFYSEVDAASRHSELLMECADNLCKTASLSPANLNMAACMKGPGSFTGLRIAYSAAKGLSLALGIPIKAVPTLDCIAHSYTAWPGIIIPAIDAKKGSFFAALYRGTRRLSGYLDAPPETIAELIGKSLFFPEECVFLTGPGAELLFSRLTAFSNPGQIVIDPLFKKGRARELLEIAKSDIVINADDLNSGPVYIRKSDAELVRIKAG